MNDIEKAFRESYPIDFDLYDKDQQNVLYIEDRPAEQQVKLEITNASTETIQLKDLSGSTVDSNTYHFALRFRPGTLSDACLDKIKLSNNSAVNWTMSISDPEKDKNGMVPLYFLAKKQLDLKPQKNISIGLLNVSPDGAQGARGTQVELLYNNMHYKISPLIPLKSTRLNHLSIINHRGKTHIPLHVGFVGSNTVLNDGTSDNTLKLRITNLMPDHCLTFKYDAGEDKASKFIFSFDIGKSSDEWALGSETQVNAIEIEMKQPPPPIPHLGWKIEKSGQGKSPEWILQPDSANQILLGQGYLDLTLSNIITDFPTGQTHLYLRYENIPGYWDGQFVCVIEKQPLVYRCDNVGIGTDNPGAKLTVSGGSYFEGGRNYFMDEEKAGRVRVGAAWNIPGFYSEDNQDIVLGVSPENKAYIGCSGQFMTVSGNGNVGIGTKDPKGKLDVNGTLKMNGQSPIIFVKYRNIGNDHEINTKYSADEYTAAVVGFQLLDGTINALTKGEIMRVYMDIKGGTWHIKPYFSTSMSTPTWTVDVMFVRKELCERHCYELNNTGELIECKE